MAGRRIPGRRVGGLLAHDITIPDINAALELARGEPQLVAVDARVLRLLMGELASLIMRGTCTSVDPRFGQGPVGGFRSALHGDLDAFIWDRDSPCD